VPDSAIEKLFDFEDVDGSDLEMEKSIEQSKPPEFLF
jgi:hypothetical protein